MTSTHGSAKCSDSQTWRCSGLLLRAGRVRGNADGRGSKPRRDLRLLGQEDKGAGLDRLPRRRPRGRRGVLERPVERRVVLPEVRERDAGRLRATITGAAHCQVSLLKAKDLVT